ncbi:MAG: hypothetical protein LIP02_07070 [Bacteroidales bacterium]|nr:hypothetical protein [Bacteroidales bacterium]
MKALTIISVALLIMGATSCRSTQTSAYQSYETRCLGVEHDGTQTLLAWGEGSNKADAVEQARKNAVYDVIFNGITAGKDGCSAAPLLNIPNARERFQEYFDIFFLDGGEYQKFCSSADMRARSGEKEKYRQGEKRSITVRIDRQGLKKRLQDDGVLPK